MCLKLFLTCTWNYLLHGHKIIYYMHFEHGARAEWSELLTNSSIVLQSHCPQHVVQYFTVNASDCVPCPFEKKIDNRPTPHDFIKYLPMFLSDNPGLTCAKGWVVQRHMHILMSFLTWLGCGIVPLKSVGGRYALKTQMFLSLIVWLWYTVMTYIRNEVTRVINLTCNCHSELWSLTFVTTFS